MTERTITYRLRAVTSDLAGPVKNARSELANTGRAVESFSQKHKRAMTVAGTAALAFGAGTAMAFNKAADAANQLNADMANVGSLIPGQTARVYELRDSVQELAVGVGKSTGDISSGLYQVVSAFGDTADTADILRINAEGARAGLASTTDAINLTSAVTKGYGDTTAEAVQQASDLALMTVRLGQTTFPELAESVGRVIPLAAGLGVTQEELFAVMATGTGVTGQAAEVSTQLRGVLQSLMAPTADMTSLLAEHGFASGEAALADLGLQGAIELVVGAAEEAGTPLQKYMSQIEGQTLAMALAGPQADVFTDKLGQMGEAAGATDEALEAMTEGIGRFQFDAEQAAVQQQVAMQKMGEAIAPMKASLMGFLGDTAEGFSNLSPEMQETAAKAGMVASAVGILGGAALITTPRLVAMNATLAATGPLGLTASRGISAVSGAVFGPWGMAAAATATATYDLKTSFREAGDDARALAKDIIATSQTAEQASRRLRRAAEERSESIGFTLESDPEQQGRVLKNALMGPIGAFFNLRDSIVDATGAWTLWRTEVDEADVATAGLELSAQRGGAAIHTLTSGTMGWIDRLGESNVVTAEMRAAAEEAGMEINEMTGEVTAAASAFDGLAPSIMSATVALADGFDPMQRYQENLQAINDAARATAEDTAESHNESIDSQIQALRDRTDAEMEAYRNETLVAEDGSRVKRSFYKEQTDAAISEMERERDARITQLEDQKTASKDYYEEETVNFAAYMASLDETLADQREWHRNLNKIREVAGDEYADMLTAQGPQFAGLHAEIAKQENSEIQQAATRSQEIRDEAATEAIDRLIRAGTQFVDETGSYNEEAVAETAEKLGTTPGVVERILNKSNTVADQRLQALIGIFGTSGETASGDLRRKLGKAIPEVARIAKQYGIDVGDAIAPLLSAIGDDRSAQAVARYIKGETITGLNRGGLLPGRGPNRDTVPAMLTRGEYVEPRDSVDYYGADVFEAFRDRQVPRDVARRTILGFNTGGRVTGDIEGLNLEFLGRIQRWASALGDTYHVTSGYRSIEEQARLYALYKAGKGNEAAPPGSSRHNFGLATDGPRWGHRGPGAHAMHYRLAHEPWHLEPIDAAALMGGATAAGGMLPGLAVQVPKPPTFPHRGVAETADTVAAYLHKTAQAFADANTLAPAMQTGSGEPPAAGSVQEMARELLNQRGWGSQWGAFDTLVRKESSWNPNAQNPTSTAYGLGQFLNSTWATVGGRKTSDPALQLEYMMRYIAQRYGTPEAALRFHLANNWYNQGGVVGMEHGGIINEPISGIGASGQRYAFGENGPERVTPMNAGGMVMAEDGSLVPASFYAGRPPRREHTPLNLPRGTMPTAPTFAGSSLRLDPDEYRRRVEINNRLFEMGMLSLSDHLSNLERRMLRTVPFSDEWMRLFDERRRLVDGMLEDHLQAVDDAQRRQDDAFDNLNQLLEERQRVTERIADEEARAADERNRALDQFNDERLRIEQRHNDERARIIRARADTLVDALPIEQRAATTWANSISAILRNEMERATQREDWAEGLDVLRGMGLSEDAIAAFGLEDLTEESIAKVRLWSTATEAEIAALNAAIAERQRFAGDQAETEAERQLGAVGEELVGLTEQTAEELEAIRVELKETLGAIDGDLIDSLTALNAEMATIGLDTGRSWADAIAEGIESGLPGILAAVEAANAARMGRLHAGIELDRAREQAAANPPAGGSAATAPLGHHYILPDGRHALRLSDQSWYWASGPGQERELERLYGPGTEHPAIQEDRIVGSLVSLFGAGGMERFDNAQIQPRYFDDGGWLAPNSLTLAANSTSRWEPVGAGTHMPAVGQDKVVAAINRQTQVIERGIEQGQVVVLDRETLNGISDHTQARLADQGDDARLRQRRGRAGVR